MRNSVDQRAQFIEKFSALCEAYEVLSDERLKSVYDRFGADGLENGVQTENEDFGGYAFSGHSLKIFKDFFGTSNPWANQGVPQLQDVVEARRQQTSARAKDVEVTLQCSLFEFYNGAFKEVSYERTYIYSNEEGLRTCEDEITVEVKPGYSKETVLRFPGLGNEVVGAFTSDLVVKFEQIESIGGFQREGDDLVFY